MPRSVFLTPFGSLGDLHPYLALAKGLQARGVRVAVGTTEAYRDRVQAQGLEFRPIGPHLNPEDPEIVKAAVDVERGSENIFRTLIMPGLRQNYEDTLRQAEGFDVLVGHILALGIPLVAEKTGRPWVSVALAPLAYMSAHEPLVFAGYPFLSWIMRGPVWVRRTMLKLGRAQTAPWMRPVADLRRELGLAPGGHPIYEGQHSPTLSLGLFSSLLGAPLPDWPANTAVTGFCLHDGGGALEPEVERFLADGPPPLVFTLGSSAVHDAGSFFEESAAAARSLGMRALLVGREAAKEADGVLRCAYAPYSKVFPRAAAVVSTAGSGTIAQGLRAGRPLVMVPYGNDQPDNAARVERLGVSRTVPRKRYERRTVAAAIRELLAEPAVPERCAQASKTVTSEDGVRSAISALERSFP